MKYHTRLTHHFVYYFLAVAVILFFVHSRGSFAVSRTHHALQLSDSRVELKQNQMTLQKKRYAQSTESEEPLRQIVRELEGKVRGLQVENKMMANEIARLRRTVEALMAQGNMIQGKQVAIDKVKRVYQGRPKKDDMMVGVPQMMAVWNQIDYILDKLDEIVVQTSRK